MKILHKKAYRSLAVLLLVAMLTPSLLPLPVSEAADAPAQSDTVPTASALSPSQLLSALIGTEISSAESDWLDHETDETLRADLSAAVSYEVSIPHELISASTAEDGSGVQVTAVPYTDTERGIAWFPVTARLGDHETLMTPEGDLTDSGVYICYLPMDETVGDIARHVSVMYEATVTLPTDLCNQLLNAAYEAVQAAKEREAVYQAALSEYQARQIAYRDYLAALKQYRADTAAYEAYREAMTLYESRLAAYEAYLDDMEHFASDMQVYEAYLQAYTTYKEAYALYLDFVENPTAYEERYLAYRAWLTEMDTVRAQLALIDSCFVHDSDGNQLYATLHGSTVATVVARQDELVSVGCDARDIANADRATAVLTTLLDAYPRLGSEAERYQFYILHYTELKENVTLLYESLAKLYGNDAVPDILQMQGKKERYWQFVAQLYVLACALDDSRVPDTDWSIAQGRLTELLDDCFLLSDRNRAVPYTQYPAPREEVPAPADIKKPTEPVPVEKPVEPLEVTQPTKPTEVRKPIPPLPVSAPGTAPEAPAISRTLQALMEEEVAGLLTPRQPMSGTIRLTPHITVEKAVTSLDRPTVSLYSDDRMTLLASVAADADGTVTLPATAPEKSPDRAYTYRFSGWVYADGARLDTGVSTLQITEDLSLYATYERIPVLYTVRWILNGETVEAQVPYGAVPTFTGSCDRAPDDQHIYTFAGWSPAPAPVTGDAEYTAQYTVLPRTYTVTWHWGEQSEVEDYHYGDLPSFDRTPTLPADGRYLYRFKAWSPVLSPVTGNAVYEAVFEAEDLAPHMAADATASIYEDTDGWHMEGTGWSDPNTGILRIDISRVADLAADSQSPLTLTSDGLTLTLRREDVLLLAMSDAIWLCAEGMDATSDAFTVYAADGYMTPIDITLRARISLTPSEGQTVRVLNEDGQLLSSVSTDGRVLFDAQAGIVYTVKQGYSVTVTTTEGGICRTDSPVTPGKTVRLLITAQPGYTFANVEVTGSDGRPIPCTPAEHGAYTFTMPAGAVAVTASFSPMTYTVSFTSDGVTLSSQAYRYGEMPTLPADPTRPADDAYTYTFIGWSPEVVAVMADCVYEAQFLAVPISGSASVADTALKLWQVILLGAAGFTVTSAGVMTPYFLVRSRKKRANDTVGHHTKAR